MKQLNSCFQGTGLWEFAYPQYRGGFFLVLRHQPGNHKWKNFPSPSFSFKPIVSLLRQDDILSSQKTHSYPLFLGFFIIFHISQTAGCTVLCLISLLPSPNYFSSTGISLLSLPVSLHTLTLVSTTGSYSI